MAFFFGKKESPTQPTAPQNSNQLTNTRIIRTLKTDLIELDSQQKDGAPQKNDKASFVTLAQPSFPEPREVSGQKIPTPPPTPPNRTTPKKEEIIINPFSQAPNQIPKPPLNEKVPTPTKDFSTIKPIHTYTSDIAENLQKQHSTISDIVQAEEAKRRNQPIEQPARPIGKTLLSIFLIILGLGLIGSSGYVIYRFAIPKKDETPITVAPVKTDLFKIDAANTANFVPEKRKIEDAFASMMTQTLEGEVRKVNFVKTSGSDKNDATAQEILQGLEVEQSELISSITPGIIIGNYKKNGVDGPFMVLRAKNSETTYLALIQWEKNLFRDLQNIFIVDRNARVLPPFFGSTADGYRYQFEDGAIQSKDIRVARNAANRPVMLYGFLDQEYILIATNSETFREIFSRFTKARYVQ